MNTKKENATAEKLLFTIGNFSVYEGRKYLVQDKIDKGAPTGYVKAGVSKLPSDGVDDVFSFKWIPTGNGKTGIWDTGFYEHSPCYKDMNQKEAVAEMKLRVRNVLTPFQKQVGDDKALENSNTESLDSTMFSVVGGQFYDTSDPMQVMFLYATLLTGSAAPKGEENSSKFSGCPYYIEDMTKKKNVKKNRNTTIMSTVSMFNKLYDTDPEKLYVVLLWLNFGNFSAKSDKDDVASMFFELINEDVTKCDSFVELLEKIEEDRNERDSLYLYSKLRKMDQRDSPLKIGEDRNVYYEDARLGGDLKAAAINLARNPEFSEYRTRILAD